MTRSAEVIAIFGPTASGKSAVAEAARRSPRHRSRVGRRPAGLPWAPGAHEPAGDAYQARRDQGSRRRDVGGRVRSTGSCSRGRARGVLGIRGRCRRNRPLPASGAGRSRSASFGRTWPPHATGGVLRRERRSGARSLAGARPASRGDRAPERPPSRRSGARACGKRKLLDSPRGPAVVRGVSTTDRDRRSRRLERGARHENPPANGGDVRTRRGRRGTQRARRTNLREPRRRPSASPSSLDSLRTKLSSASSFGRGAMPPTRGSGCAGFRASS